LSRRLRYGLVGGASLLFFYLIAALFVPRFVEVDRYRPAVESRLSALLGRRVALGTLSLSLWTGVEVHADRLTIEDAHGVPPGTGMSLVANRLAVRPELFPLFRREVRLRSVRLDEGTWSVAGKPILKDLALRSRVRRAGATGGRVMGSIEGSLALREGSALRATFDALIEGERVVIESLSATAGPAKLEAKGEIAGIRGESPRVTMEGSGSLGATRATGTVALEMRGGEPVVTFDVASPLVDFDDLTRLATGPERQVVTSSVFFPAAIAAAESPSARGGGLLERISGSGRLEAEAGRMAGIEMTSLSSEVRLAPGTLHFEDASCRVYGGTNRANVVVDLRGDGLPFHLVGAANGVSLRPLVADAAPSYRDALDGTASMALDLWGEAAREKISHTLRGKARIEVRDGKLATFGILSEVAQVLEMAGGRGIGKSETPFDHLSASFVLENGAAQTRDLEFRSADLDLDGGGEIGLDGPLGLEVVTSFSKQATSDLVRRTPQLEFRVGRDGRMTIPLRIRGTLMRPQVQLDLDRVLQEGLGKALKDRAKTGLLRRLLEKD
jgi:hypothetical protein